MNRAGIEWESEFPLEEEVEDYAGKRRKFTIRCDAGPHGFTVRATEQGRDVDGYEFAAFHEVSPSSALGRV